MTSDQSATKADLKAELEKFERDLKPALANLKRDLTRNVAIVTIVAVIAVIASGCFSCTRAVSGSLTSRQVIRLPPVIMPVVARGHSD
jgi:hypothetical protein